MTDLYYYVVTLLSAPTLNVDVPNKNVSETTIIDGLLNTVYALAGVAAVISIIVGSFWYITGGDNPSQVQKGKNAIIYASIGLVVVLFAFGITGFVSGRLKF